MCQECGCGLGSPETPGAGGAGGGIVGHWHSHGHGHGDDPGSGLNHQPGGESGHGPAPGPGPGPGSEGSPGGVTVGGEVQRIQVQRSLMEQNDRQAERNRGFFAAKGLLVFNVLGSPGAGKTALLERTGELLLSRSLSQSLSPLRMGAIVGDLATDHDARRLRAAGLPVVQISTGTLCHLDAGLVSRAMGSLDLDALDVLAIENVGNLVCPAGFDLGERIRVVLLSVTEGEDKPLKYPPIFHSADVVLITKTDLAAAAGFDRSLALAHLHEVSHHARVFEVSARTGAGMDAWVRHLAERHEALRA